MAEDSSIAYIQDHDLVYKVALTFVPNIGPVLGKNLISYCGSAKAVLEASKSDLAKIPGIGKAKIEDISASSTLDKANNELERCAKYNINVLDYTSKNYPTRLRNVENAPIILYKLGTADLNAHRTIGIIGTRTPTNYGRIQTEQLVESLKPLNVTTVSGMAHGIDTLAHRKSVEVGIPTIGVLGNGIDMVYPAENRALYDKVVKTNGALITEFALGVGPDKQNFPMRNRIIAALSDATIVVESKVKGGSIITAEYANEYNRDVFAYPGKTDDVYSQGCNGLIKKHKAHMIESVNDLMYIMRWDAKAVNTMAAYQGSLFDDLSPMEQDLVDQIRTHKEVSIDELTYKTSKSIAEVSTTLLTLEFKGLVRSLPGKIYCLK